MANSQVSVTEGSGKNLATYSVSETTTKEISRVALNDSTGTAISPATSAKQDTGNTSLSSIDGKITAVNTGAVTISGALPTGTNVIGKTSIDQTTPGTTNLVALTAETTKVIGTVRAASGGFASGSISDGADVTLGAKADAKSTATDTTAVTAMQVLKEISFMAQTPAALPANQSVNVAQVNGVATTTGNGVSGTGVQRVTIASDSTGQSTITDGTNVANVLKSDGTAAGQNALLIGNSRLEVSFTTVSAQAVASTDVSGYRWVGVQITSQGTTSTVTFQASNDNANWVSIALYISSATGSTAAVVSTTAASSYYGPLNFRYFRLNVTGISAGTTAGIVEFMTMPSGLLPNNLATSQLSLADNADGVVASATANGLKTMSAIRLFDGTNYNRAQQVVNATNSIGTGIPAAGILAQFDDVSPTAITENSFGNLRMSANRNFYTTIRDAAGNERGLNIDASGQIAVTNAGTFAVQGTITDGTNTANVLKSDGTAAGQNAQLIGNGYLSVAYTTTSIQAVGSTDVGNYRWVSVQQTSSGGSSVTNFQGSNDNSNWVSVNLIGTTNTSNAASSSTSSTGVILHGPLGFRYFRLNVTGIVSGTTAGTIVFSTMPTFMQTLGVGGTVGASQSGTWNITNAGTFAVQATTLAHGKTIVSKTGSAASSGNNTLVAAGTNKLKVFAFSLSTLSTTAVTVKFQDGASGTDLWSAILQAPTSISTGANLAVSPPAWLFNTSSATLLNLNLSSANAVQWSVAYFDEA